MLFLTIVPGTYTYLGPWELPTRACLAQEANVSSRPPLDHTEWLQRPNATSGQPCGLCPHRALCRQASPTLWGPQSLSCDVCLAVWLWAPFCGGSRIWGPASPCTAWENADSVNNIS